MIENDHQTQEERRRWLDEQAQAAIDHAKNCPVETRLEAQQITDLLFARDRKVY